MLQVTDDVTAATPADYNDIKSQTANNYDYDEIGNLTKDASAGIGANGISWSVYGKILQINQTKNGTAQNITYTYDAAGNRISKTVNGATTWYVRDASGNTMAVYKAGDNTLNSGHITLQERHLYGSSRLGISSLNLDISAGLVIPLASGITTTTNAFFSSFDRGQKFFELTNHLGNVLVTVSDKKLQVQGNGVTDNNGSCAAGTATDVLNVSQRNGEAHYIARTEVDFLPGFESNDNENFSAYIDNDLAACVPYTPPATPAQGWFYTADIISANDYAPFGMQMVGRTFNAGGYRYGFNGKENDNEVKGEGNQYDYGFRIYDPRLGRFLSTDPLSSKFPWYTPYQFAGNKPIWALDLDGLEDVKYNDFKNDLAYQTYQIKASITNTIIRLNPTHHGEILRQEFAKVGITDKAFIDNFHIRMRTIVTTSPPNEFEPASFTIENKFVIEEKSSFGREFLEAAFDVLAVTSVIPTNNSTGVFAARGAGQFFVNLAKNSIAILYNVRRLSTIGETRVALIGVQKLEDIMEAGKAFVGKNAKEIRTVKGKLEAIESSDGLRRFRPPAKKSFGGGTIQANFEQRINDQIKWGEKATESQRSNMHVVSDKVYTP